MVLLWTELRKLENRLSLFSPIRKYFDASSMVRVYFSHTGMSCALLIKHPFTFNDLCYIRTHLFHYHFLLFGKACCFINHFHIV